MQRVQSTRDVCAITTSRSASPLRQPLARASAIPLGRSPLGAWTSSRESDGLSGSKGIAVDHDGKISRIKVDLQDQESGIPMSDVVRTARCHLAAACARNDLFRAPGRVSFDVGSAGRAFFVDGFVQMHSFAGTHHDDWPEDSVAKQSERTS